VSFRWEAEIMPRSEWKRLDGGSQLLRLGDFNPPVLGALLPRQEYPKHLYHKTLPAVIGLNADEEAKARVDGYGDDYAPQEYPKWKYHWTKPAMIVKNTNEETALGGGWADKSDAFAPYKGPRPPQTDQPDPVKWVDAWPVPVLSAKHRNQIKAALLTADAEFSRSPDADSVNLASMKHAFSGISKVLFKAGILTEQHLQNEIPLLVWDSAIAGGWWRFASETRQDIFPEQLGHYWVWRDESNDWQTLFRAETARWGARLLSASPAPRRQVKGAELAPQRKRALGLTKQRGTRTPEKGNLNILLDTDGKRKRAVTLDVARRFSGVSRRAIDAATHKGSLKTEGKRQQRRVLVESLLEYFPLEK
jgi:hypothetical protein